MENNFSIRINRQEGLVEVSGNDKDWVKARLDELKPIYDSPITTPVPDNTKQPPIGMEAPVTLRRRNGGKKKRGAAGGLRSEKNPDLVAKLTKEVQVKLADFVSERKNSFDGSLSSQAAIIATFLQDALNWTSVNHSDMYTVYSVMGWPAPGNPRAQLINAQARFQYFGGVTNGKYPLSHAGENYGRHDSKTGEE